MKEVQLAIREPVFSDPDQRMRWFELQRGLLDLDAFVAQAQVDHRLGDANHARQIRQGVIQQMREIDPDLDLEMRRLEEAQIPYLEMQADLLPIIARDARLDSATKEVSELFGIPSRFGGDAHAGTSPDEYFAVAAEMFLYDRDRFESNYNEAEVRWFEDNIDRIGPGQRK